MYSKINSPTESFHLHFVGVGPQRTGTTWLYQILQHYPTLCLPKDVKETMFFDRYYAKGLPWYAVHYAHQKKNQRCGEISPTYFGMELTSARIHQLNPQCRIIINLRNPIDRAFSLFRHLLTVGQVNGSFSEAVSYMPSIIESGQYARHIPRWLDTFGADQVTFILLDDIALRPKTVLTGISDFLGMPQMPLPAIGSEKINAPTKPRFSWAAKKIDQLSNELHARRLHKIVSLGKKIGLKKLFYTESQCGLPELSINDHQWLLEQYDTDIAYLENLLGRNLSVWRQKQQSVKLSIS